MASDFIMFSSCFVPIISATCDFSALCRTLFPPDLIPTEESIHLSFHHMRPLISPGAVALAGAQAQTQAGRQYVESTPEEKDSGLLVDEELNVPLQCVLAAQKGNHILSCIKRTVTSRSGMRFSPFTSLL